MVWGIRTGIGGRVCSALRVSIFTSGQIAEILTRLMRIRGMGSARRETTRGVRALNR